MAASSKKQEAGPRGGSWGWTFLLVVATVLILVIILRPASEQRPVEPPGLPLPTGGVWFEEVSDSGIDFVHVRNQPAPRYWLPEIMGGGLALFDHDGDGDLDLYLVQSGRLPVGQEGGPGNRLYENLGDCLFRDVTDTSGTGDGGYGMGCACGDYDNDGDVDLYVMNVGANVLYRNQGDGTYLDVTAEAGVGDNSWSSSGAFFDHDLDGDLDLLVVNYIGWSPQVVIPCNDNREQRDYCSPKNFEAPAPDVLYRNNGDGSFTDITAAAGLDAAFGNGLGVLCADFDRDGRGDLYIANDGTPNQLWMGGADGRYTESALLAGCAVNRKGTPEAGMGVAAADLDGDGFLEVFVTHLRQETNTLYANRDGIFDDRTHLLGLAAPSLWATGFGTGFADFDCDGDQDLFVGNGGVTRTGSIFPDAPYALPNQLFEASDAGHLREVSLDAGTPTLRPGATRGVALADLDGDGDVDLVLQESGGPPRLLRNSGQPRGSWVMFRVLEAGGRDSHGAMVRITCGRQHQWRLAHPTSSYQTSTDPRVHFGLGELEQINEVAVVWPGGELEVFGAMDARAIHDLCRGRGGKR